MTRKAKIQLHCDCLADLVASHQIDGLWVDGSVGCTEIRFQSPLKKPVRATPRRPWIRERLFTQKSVFVKPSFCPHCGALIVAADQLFSRIEPEQEKP
jgi:hypothetical protein